MEKFSVGHVVKKKFYIAMLTGLFAFFSLIATFGFTGTAFALPLGGMGDFFVKFDKLEGKAFQLLPHKGETGTSDAAPMVRNKMDSATIEGLHIYKDLKVPGLGWVRFHVKADKTDIKGLIQDARFIDANLSLTNMHIREKNTEEFSQNWTQTADTITITNAKIVTDYLFQAAVSLNGAKISAELIDEPEIINQ